MAQTAGENAGKRQPKKYPVDHGPITVGPRPKLVGKAHAVPGKITGNQPSKSDLAKARAAGAKPPKAPKYVTKSVSMPAKTKTYKTALQSQSKAMASRTPRGPSPSKRRSE